MKAIDLANRLLKYPDFDVKFTVFEEGVVSDWMITGVSDIGHSDKVIVLGGEENW